MFRLLPPTYYLCVRDGQPTVRLQTVDEALAYPETYVLIAGPPVPPGSPWDQSRHQALELSRLGVPPSLDRVTVVYLPDCYERDLRVWCQLESDSVTDTYRQLLWVAKMGIPWPASLEKTIRIRDSDHWEHHLDEMTELCEGRALFSRTPRPTEMLSPVPLTEGTISHNLVVELGRYLVSIGTSESHRLLQVLCRRLASSPTYYQYVMWTPSLRRVLGEGGSTLCYLMLNYLVAEYSPSLPSTRYVINLDQAHGLPVVPFRGDSPDDSPYCIPLYNVAWGHGIKLQYRYEGTIRTGICDLQTFRQRLEVWCGHPRALADVNWNRVALTGSTMAALLPERHPLVEGYSRHLDGELVDDEQLRDYYQTYYASSAVDLLCTHRTEEEYLAEVVRIVQGLRRTLQDDSLRVTCVHRFCTGMDPDDGESEPEVSESLEEISEDAPPPRARRVPVPLQPRQGSASDSDSSEEDQPLTPHRPDASDTDSDSSEVLPPPRQVRRARAAVASDSESSDPSSEEEPEPRRRARRVPVPRRARAAVPSDSESSDSEESISPPRPRHRPLLLMEPEMDVGLEQMVASAIQRLLGHDEVIVSRMMASSPRGSGVAGLRVGDLEREAAQGSPEVSEEDPEPAAVAWYREWAPEHWPLPTLTEMGCLEMTYLQSAESQTRSQPATQPLSVDHEEETFTVSRALEFWIHSDYLARPICLYPIHYHVPGVQAPEVDLMSHVAGHHYPPVRAAYTQGECQLCPSAILSYQTLTISDSWNTDRNYRQALDQYWDRGWMVVSSAYQKDRRRRLGPLHKTVLRSEPHEGIHYTNVIW